MTYEGELRRRETLGLASRLLARSGFPARPTAVGSYLLRRIELAQASLGHSADVDPEFWVKRLDILRDALGTDHVAVAGNPESVATEVMEWSDLRIERHAVRVGEELRVPVDLYIPTGEMPPAGWPAILHVPGHWIENGRLTPDIQANAVMLTRSGFTVAVCDPQGQGSRFRGWQLHNDTAQLLNGVCQAGSMLAEYRTLVTWMSARPEINSERIGVTGASGGGLATVYLPVVDDRIRAAAPVCYAVEYSDLLVRVSGTNWNGGVDLCNQVPGLADIATMAGVLTMYPMVPVLIISAEEDPQFPPASSEGVAIQATQWRARIPGASSVRNVIVPGGHGYSGMASKEVCKFFLKHLADGAPSDTARLEVLPGRQDPVVAIDYLAAAEGGRNRPIHQSIVETPDRAEGAAKVPDTLPLSHVGNDRGRVRGSAEVDSILGLYEPNGWSARIEREWNFGCGRSIQRVLLTTEPGISVPLWLSVPVGSTVCAPVLVFGACGVCDALEAPIMAELWDTDTALAVLELRGHGETAGVDFELSTTALMLKAHLFAQRVADVRTAVNYLAQTPGLSRQLRRSAIDVIVLGQECGLYGAASFVTDNRLSSLFFADPPKDWSEIDPRESSYGVLVPGVSRRLNLRELLAARPDGRVGTRASFALGWPEVADYGGSLASWLAES